MVGLDGLAADIVGELVLDGLRAGPRGRDRAGAIVVAQRRERNLVRRVEIEEVLRRNIGRVRAIKADREEERARLALEAFEQLDRLGGADAVGVIYVLALVVGEPAQRAAKLAARA